MPTSPVLEQLQKRAAVQRPGTDPNRINQPTLYGQPAPGTPSVVGSQGKAPGEWVGSRYVGPTAPAAAPASPAPAPPAAPVNTPAMPPGNTQILQDAGGVTAPGNARWGGGTPGPSTVAQAGQPATQPPQQGGDKAWLDWIAKTYGNSASRGGGFADLPQGQTLESVIGRYNTEIGANAKYVGGASGDKADFGLGTTDALTGQGQLWYNYGPGGPPGAAGARAGGGGGGGGDPRPGTPAERAAAAAGGAGGSFQDQTRALLMAQMQGLSGPVTANDPAIKAAMDAARLESERGVDQTRKDQAERMFAEGSLNSNALGQAVQQSRERGATGLSTLQGDLMMRETTAKRASLAQLLQQALQTGDNESARALQLRLGQMDNAIRQQQLAQQGAQWNDQYGLNVQDAQYQRDRDAARAKAGQPF